MDEFVNNLQTYEANHHEKKKSKGIVLDTRFENIKLIPNQKWAKIVPSTVKDFVKKNIRNTFIIFFQITQHLSKRSSASNSQENKSESKKDKKIKNEKPIDVRCFECHGFGHMTHECANTLKKKMGKAMQAIWDDSDVEVSYD